LGGDKGGTEYTVKNLWETYDIFKYIDNYIYDSYPLYDHDRLKMKHLKAAVHLRAKATRSLG
jgi:hypothetical protein